MTEFIKKFRVLEDGRYRIAIKVSGGSRLSEILQGVSPIDFGFVRTISGGAIFMSEVITVSRGNSLFFRVLSDSEEFIGSEFRTFFASVDGKIKFQDIVAEEYNKAEPEPDEPIPDDPDEPDPDDPDEPVYYGPDLTPSMWYSGYTLVQISSNTTTITIPSDGVYQVVVCLADPFFIESATITSGNQWDPTGSTTKSLTGWISNPKRYYYNSTDTILDDLSCDCVNNTTKLTIKINTSDPAATYRKSAVLLKRKRDLDVAAPYINRIVSGSLVPKQYIGYDGSSLAERISVSPGRNEVRRLIAARADNAIKSETSIPDKDTLMVVRYGNSAIGTAYKFTAAGDTMWPAKGTTKIVSNAIGADGNTYDRWVSREIVLGNDQLANYGSCEIYRTGNIKVYQKNSSGANDTFELVNPKTGKTEVGKYPIGITTTAYAYGYICPAGRVLTCRRVKVSSNFDTDDALEIWRNSTPINLLDGLTDTMKQSTTILVVEVIQSSKSSLYDSATGTFALPGATGKGRLYVSKYADGEDGVDYQYITTAAEYKKYLGNSLIRDPENPKKHLEIWDKVDLYYSMHQIFRNVTASTAESATVGPRLFCPWFCHNEDPSHIYYFIRMRDIFGSGSKFDANAAKRLMVFPGTGMDVYVSVLSDVKQFGLTDHSAALALNVSP